MTVKKIDGIFSVCRVAEFSLIGILSGISTLLAEHQTGIFAVPTYNTDYILTKERDCLAALRALSEAGYQIES